MRSVPSYIETRLKKNIQTRANDSAPSARLWLSRPSTALSNSEVLERQTVTTGSITDVSIAVCHPHMRRASTDIFAAYISNGVAKVTKAKHAASVNQHIWADTGFEENATAISIAFDGTMATTYGSEVEFVTERTPWVFWANDGALYAQKLGGETVTLAEANCTDVSAIRAPWSAADTFDFGLVVFFILGGSLYYRQLIHDEWTDAETVSFGPSGISWSSISAFRTWDYRIGIQAKSTTGDIYELFTQFMSFGSRNAEHIDITSIARTKDALTKLNRYNRATAEHINLSDIRNMAPYQGVYALGTPSLISVYNIDDGHDNFGKTVVLVFDKELDNETVQTSIGSFYFVDGNGYRYFPTTIKMDGTGRKATLTFVDFNDAVGVCTVHYDPGDVVTMAGEVLTTQSVGFTPEGLVPGTVKRPEVVEILAENEIGTEVSVRFTMPITGIGVGCEDDFIVTINYPEYVPGGNISPVICPVIGVTRSDSNPNTIILHFQDGMVTSIRNAVGEVTVQYIGTTLMGEQGHALSFNETFAPVGLYMKPNPNDAEHITISRTTKLSALTHVDHVSRKSEEHMAISNITKLSVLLHVDDI